MRRASAAATAATSEPRVETPRLVLRPIRSGDVERCVEILLAGGAAPGRDHVADFRDEVEHWTEHGFGPWVAEGRESGAIVGIIDVNYAGPGIVGIHPEEVEVGWMIDRALWGRGLATEGGRAACEDAYERVGVDALVAYVRPDNLPSLRVVEKLGMTYDGDGRSREGEDVRIFRMRR